MIAFASRFTSAFGKSTVASSNLAVGTATSFVLCTALVAVSMDRQPDQNAASQAVVVQSDLMLRGTLAPNDRPLPPAPAEAPAPTRAIMAGL